MEKIRPYWEMIVRFWKKKHLTQLLLLVILIVILTTIVYFGWLATRANVQTLKEGLSQPTVIYDHNGKIATNVATNRTGGAKIEELPKYVPGAVVAIEDERFYEHNGFDIKGITRAFFNNIFAGEITGGGSTLTQQLAKNALLSPEQTYKRKAEELFLAVKIEKVYKKDEILQMYLNQVYFGSGAWGISNASKRYFNKEINEVTISEAALLAGLLQSPNYLDPTENYDAAMKRRDVVLSKMNELGMITKDQYTVAKDEKIKINSGSGSLVERKYPYYVDAVLNEAISKYGLTQEEILTRGYRIYTELDQNLQTGLEKVNNNKSLFPKGKGDSIVQSGSVLMDPASGGVRALVGGRGEHVFRGFNRATQLKAQPGSTIKPLAVYTPALLEGYTFDSELIDEPTSYGDYKPENFSKTYQGKVQLYKGLEESLNVPTVWLLNKIGLEKGLDSLKAFGVPVEKEDRNLAIALGGMNKGISPQQLANAFSAFPNGGKRNDSHLITKIVGPTGNILAEREPKSTKVTSKEIADEMTSMLLNVVESGTGKNAHIPGVQIAGKTGSTQLPYSDINGTKDQWMVGYTPNLVAAIWIGYDQTDRKHYLPSSSSGNVVPIFKEIMKESLPHIQKEEFDVVSINDQLAGKTATREKIKKQAEKISEELNQNAQKLGEKIQEQAPVWKKDLEDAMFSIGKGIDTIIQKLKGLTE
ncbi:PBP1A family penicillin-binding protein [Bacillus sp. EB106-08-02-XG196]|uniref:transglycosylase domain-containing protein n=1 Tax=Bacillus sp. EB106-08-02-XG196 TaxID=2737049 RepID=UPI0015C4AE46|nr:PBP1A family penicillin-binding protein [Bacillus sp. EB106-08-02-XG196]NWQ41573.1 PBP1A family penicillin-binding protein [Bacillus sp. EB106-08-02-XG196]